jgi:hypothetical protein
VHSGGDIELKVGMPMGKLLEPSYPICVGSTSGSSHYADPHPVFTRDNLKTN